MTGYSAWSVVAFEVPTAAKWNLLGTNDTGFYNAITDIEAGWVPANETWTYASATTITVPTGATNKYRVGDKIRLKQGGSYKYFSITVVAATLLTVTGGTDYTVANSAITDNYFSHQENPFGFPYWFNFTSTWATSGTPPSLGNGALTGKFRLDGKWATVIINWSAGSTTTFGTGIWSFTLPFSGAASSAFNVKADDSGTAPYAMGAFTSAALVYPIYQNTYVQNTAPFTWATNDNIAMTGVLLTNL